MTLLSLPLLPNWTS